MANELMPCPVCGAPVRLGLVTVQCTTCAYCLAEEEHITLARRAEIGRLVEELAKRPKGGLWVLEREDGKFFVDCDRTPPGSVIEAATLLDALRLLAAECQIPEKP